MLKFTKMFLSKENLMEQIKVVIMLDEDVEPNLYGVYIAERPLEILNGFASSFEAISWCKEMKYEIINSLGEVYGRFIE